MAKVEKKVNTALVPAADKKKGKKLKLIAAQIDIPTDRLKSIGTRVNGEISTPVKDQVVANLAPDVDIVKRQQPRTIEFTDETFEIDLG